MRRLPLWGWLTFSHLLVLLLPAAALLATGALAHELQMQAKGTLIHQGAAVARLVAAMDEDADLRKVIGQIEADTDSRIWLLDTRGIVRVSSLPDEQGRSFADRLEVARALQGRPGGVAAGLTTVTTPIVRDGQQVGVVLESRAPRRLLHFLWISRTTWTSSVAVALGATVLLSLVMARWLGRSLMDLSAASHRIAAGALDGTEGLEPLTRARVAEVAALSTDMLAMTSRLRERLAYIAEFAGNVSHEFKTPITTLGGTIELLQEHPDMAAPQRERLLVNAAAELERLERLVAGLLDLARAEEVTAAEDVDLDVLMEELGDRYPEVRCVPGAGAVRGSREQLDVALSNLIENALRHGGPQVRVEVRGRRSAEAVGVEVCDDGPGISEANQRRIFDRFFTTDRGAGGVGLGLALVQAVAHAHGGRVEVESRPGATCFRLWLPTRPSQEEVSPAAGPAPAAS